MKNIFLIGFLLFLSPLTKAGETICDLPFDDLPIQAGGRVKPLYVQAQDTLKFMTGEKNPLQIGTTKTFCLLSFSQMGLSFDYDLKIKIDHPEIREEILQMRKSDGASYSINKLLEKNDLLRIEYTKIKENNGKKKELQKILNRIRVYQEVTQATTWTLFSKTDPAKWLPLKDYLSAEKVEEMQQENSKNPLVDLINQSRLDYQQEFGTTYLLELHYVKAHYFSWALLISLVALILLLVVKNVKIGLIVSFISIAVQIVAVILRVYISGRAPITNMYETVMFSGLGAHILALFLTIYLKNKVYTIAGLIYNILCLMMMMLANNMLDSSISPLVPVLRDNFWLSTHVTTVILSYAALAVSWILANIALLKRTFSPVHYKEKEESQFIYTAIKFGVVLLAAGVILGGVWADYSWGRFWGWDPKETWSLIVLLVYMAILHGKYTQWINNHRFISLVALAFLSVVMAWFGVNYILASGLHSYGFSEGGAIFIGSVFLVQTVIFLITIKKAQPKAEPSF